MKLEDLNVYCIAMKVGEEVWEVVYNWKYFEQRVIGSQLQRSVDSIAANIAEGFGRYSFKENKQFCYYARGSLFETIVWLKKSRTRNLLKEEDYQKIITDLRDLSVKLNNYINSLGSKKTTV
jgi:four helix bundle protein